jgi:hypothetical protein
MGCQYKYISLQYTHLTFNTMPYNLGPIYPVKHFKFTPEISKLYIYIYKENKRASVSSPKSVIANLG